MTLRFKILLLGVLSIAGLLLAFPIQYSTYTTQVRAMEAVAANVKAARMLSEATHKLQIERGLTTIRVSMANGQSYEDLARDTDRALSSLAGSGVGIASLGETLSQVRQWVATGTMLPLLVMDSYSGMVQSIVDEMGRPNREFDAALVKTDIAAHAHLVAAKEYLGQSRATLGYWLETRREDSVVVTRLIRLKSLYEEELRKVGLLASPGLRDTLSREFSGKEVRQMLDTVAQIVASGRRPPELDVQTWWAIATHAIDRLKSVEDYSLDSIEKAAEGELANLRSTMQRGLAATLAVGLAVIILAVSASVALIRTLEGALASMEIIASSQDFRRRIPAEASNEIGRISRSFNQLLDIAERLLTEKDYLARTDPLTGINNRLRFADVLSEEAERKWRTARPMALVMFDIDHFKRINDTYGHNVGDEVLVALAKFVGSRIRATDFFARWGGEEFVLLFRDDDCDAAVAAAEKLRKAIASVSFVTVGELRCSFGVTAWRLDDTEESLVARADGALYESKEGGRNRVCCPRGAAGSCRGRALCRE